MGNEKENRRKKHLKQSITGIFILIVMINMGILFARSYAVNASNELDSDIINEHPPMISIDDNTLPAYWCNNTDISSSFHFTVTTYEHSESKSVFGEVENGTVTIEILNEETGEYRATVYADEGLVVDDKVTITAMDDALRESKESTISNIRVDNSIPTITSIEENDFDSWKTNPATFEFTVEDSGSSEISLYGEVNNGEVEIIKKEGTANIYIARVLANENMVVNAPVQITAMDAVGNQLLCMTRNDIKVDNQPITISNVIIEKMSGTADKTVIKNGDEISVRFTLTDGIGSGINNNTVKVGLNDYETLTATNNGSDYSVTFLVNSDLQLDNKEAVSLTKILYEDNAGNASSYSESIAKQMIYYAPITVDSLSMVSNNSTTQNTVARDNDSITTTFCTNHPVVLSKSKISGKDVPFTSEDGEHWQASYTVEQGAVADNSYINCDLIIIDSAGNESVILDENDSITDKIKYYAPIQLSLFSIFSNNANGKLVAKDGDTVTLNFESNHEVQLEEASIAGKDVTITHEKSGDYGQRWTVTYQVNHGDLTDLSFIDYTIFVSDIAGNGKQSNGEMETNKADFIQYYAPIITEISIASDNLNKSYIKNGDTILLTCKTNHPVIVSSATVYNRNIQHSENSEAYITLEYQIPIMETMLTQGEIPFDYILTDLAGNSCEVSEKDSNVLQKLIYDRTNPTSTLFPNKMLFTAKSIVVQAEFSDENLSAQDISVMINDTEMMTEEDRIMISDKNAVKEIVLNQEGDYTIKASAIDKAGNKSNPDALMKLTIDKSKPKINGTGIMITQPSVQKPGFIIGDYFQFEDVNIKEILCTLTNRNGTFEWNIDDPITVEGKNTISLIVVDLAGNTSETITYDMYIDSICPKPFVKDEISQVVLNSSEEAILFTSKVKFGITLEALHIPEIANPDQFTILKLLDKQGNLVMDILKEIQPEDGKYLVPILKNDKYTLVVNARDDVGNETGLMKYNFELIKKQGVNVTMLVIVLTIVGTSVGICLLIMGIKLRKKA